MEDQFEAEDKRCKARLARGLALRLLVELNLIDTSLPDLTLAARNPEIWARPITPSRSRSPIHFLLLSSLLQYTRR